MNFQYATFFRCGLPVCNEICENGVLHQKYECPLFAKAFEIKKSKDGEKSDDGNAKCSSSMSKLPKIENLYAPCPLYTCITPLRLLIREWNAEKSGEELVSSQNPTLAFTILEIVW